MSRFAAEWLAPTEPDRLTHVMLLDKDRPTPYTLVRGMARTRWTPCAIRGRRFYRAEPRRRRSTTSLPNTGVAAVSYSGVALTDEYALRSLQSRDYADAILALDAEMAQICWKLRVPHAENPLNKKIAAMALMYSLTAVMRNARHYEPTGVAIPNLSRDHDDRKSIRSGLGVRAATRSATFGPRPTAAWRRLSASPSARAAGRKTGSESTVPWRTSAHVRPKKEACADVGRASCLRFMARGTQ